MGKGGARMMMHDTDDELILAAMLVAPLARCSHGTASCTGKEYSGDTDGGWLDVSHSAECDKLCLAIPPCCRGTSGCRGGNGRRHHAYCRKVNPRKSRDNRPDAQPLAPAAPKKGQASIRAQNVSGAAAFSFHKSQNKGDGKGPLDGIQVADLPTWMPAPEGEPEPEAAPTRGKGIQRSSSDGCEYAAYAASLAAPILGAMGKGNAIMEKGKSAGGAEADESRWDEVEQWAIDAERESDQMDTIQMDAEREADQLVQKGLPDGQLNTPHTSQLPRPGQAVVVRGLMKRPDLNGLPGQVTIISVLSARQIRAG
jgi:hypothetical protein